MFSSALSTLLSMPSPSLTGIDIAFAGPNRRIAPRRFGDVTIRVHQGPVPKPLSAGRATVSDFTDPYTPGRKGNGRPAASYRAARRNAGREYRRVQMSVGY